ncbi:unnamed protein product [Pipistrellus nathusii]|uniref:Transmembrane protein 132C n=1 Tax=Pipistrellus nathusii TaxID=59473 RepID=A0ABN9ZNS4_PIPNA
MRSDGAAPGPVAPLCGLSLVLGALLGGGIEGRGAPDAGPGVSSPLPYLPVSLRVLGADAAFLLRGAPPDPAPNASLQARVESFFAYRAPRPPLLLASLGPFSAERALPLGPASASASASASTLTPGGPSGTAPLGWRLRAHVLQDKVYPGRPVAQVLFQVLGRDWAEPEPSDPEPLPCLRAFAFREAREVRAGCRPRGALALCVAELRLPPGWFGAPAAGTGRRRPAGPEEGSPVELYYTVHAAGAGPEGCAGGGGGLRTGNAIRAGRDGRGGGPEDAAPPLRRAGTVRLLRAQDRGDRLRELRLDGHVAVWLPARPAKPGDVVTASVTVAGNSTVDRFSLRARVKKGVTVRGARPSEPGQWAVRQERAAGGKLSTGASTVVCQRLAPGNRSSSTAFHEVAQLSLEVAGGLSGSQPVVWQLEYPGVGAVGSALSQIFVSPRDLAGIVPLATVSDRCDQVFVNGREVKGQVDAVVTFAYQHLSAPLHLTVWAPRLPLHIEVSDPELNQIKGWRVPVADSKRPTPAREERGEEDEDAPRGRGCALQYQRASVRVLTRFLAEAAGPWAQPRLLLGPDWQVDVTPLVAASMKLEAPRVASLLDGRVLVGREPGMTAIQVLSPLSDSILGEKTVTVSEDRVSLTDLAVQLVAGLSVSLHPSPENPQVVTAVAQADELLRAPKQEAVVSTWLRFSDGSVAPLDVYDRRDFALSVSSLDEAVVSAAPARAPGWPAVAAAGEGQGPLVRVDLSIAGPCQKARRRSVLASGVGGVRVRFGPKDAEGETGNRAGGRRPQGAEAAERGGPEAPEEGAARRGGPTAGPRLDPQAARGSRTDGARPPAAGQAHRIPLDLSRFPAQEAPGAAGAGAAGGGPAPGGPRGLSDLEIGMYALLAAFCLAILVFLANCAAFALRFRRRKQLPPEGATSSGGAAGGTHSHDWVRLGHAAELLDGAGRGSPPLPLPPTPPSPAPQGRTATLDLGPARGEDPSRLLRTGGGSPRRAQGQAPRAAAPPGGRPGPNPRPEPPPSPSSGRRKVQFASFPGVSPETASPSAPSGAEDAPWVCPDRGLGAPRELRTHLDPFRDAV